MTISPERAERNYRLFSESAAKLFDRERKLIAFTLDMSLRELMNKYGIDYEQANTVLARHKIQFVQDEKETWRWDMREATGQDPVAPTDEADESKRAVVRLQPPTVIPVHGELPRPTRSGPKNDSDGQYYRLDQDA